MDEILESLLVVVKTIGLYVMALAGFRVMGKRTLGDMEPVDFVVVLAIAEIVGAPLADPELSVVPAIVAVVTLVLLQFLIAQISLRSPRLQGLAEGHPVVVIREGRVLRQNLKRARISPAELAERLRERGFSSPSDVALAILETDGMLSAVPKHEASPVTPRYLGLEGSTAVLLWGKVEKKGLEKVGMTEQQLRKTLGRRNLRFEDVEEAFVDPRGHLRLTVKLSHHEDQPKTKPSGRSGPTGRGSGRGGGRSRSHRGRSPQSGAGSKGEGKTDRRGNE